MANSWEQRKLGDTIDFYSGLTYSPSDIVEDDGVLVLRSSNVQEGEIVDEDNVYVCADAAKSDNVIVGDIIVVVRNGSRSLIGKHAKIKKNMPKTVIGAFMTGLRYKNSGYLNAVLNTSIFEKEIEKDLGATINQITTGAFKKMAFPFPKHPEQLQIGYFFEQIDNLITLHQRKFNPPPMSILIKKRKQLKRIIANAWEQRKVNNIAEMTYGGGTPSTVDSDLWEGEIPWIQSSDLTEHDVLNVSVKKHISDKAIRQSATQLVPQDSIAIITRVGVGKVAYMPFSYTTSQDFVSLSKLKVNGLFAVYLLYLRLQKDMNIVQGTSIKGITKEELLNKPICVPNIEREQAKIGVIFKQIDNLITLHQQGLIKIQGDKYGKKRIFR